MNGIGGWTVGHIGGRVLIRIVRHGEIVIADEFEPSVAEELVRRINGVLRDLRPQPPPLPLKVVK